MLSGNGLAVLARLSLTELLSYSGDNVASQLRFAPYTKGLAGVCTDPPSFIIITVKTDIAAGHIVGDYGV